MQILDLSGEKRRPLLSMALTLVALRTVVFVLGARAVRLSTLYWLSAQAPPRHTVESAWILFIVAGALARCLGGGREPMVRVSPPPPIWTLAIFCALSAALFWPSLWIGLLSDDFVLVDHAWRWNLGAYNAEAFRPVPLVIWALLLRAGATAIVLHAVNLALHGLNGYLTSRVVGPFVPGSGWALAAGVVLVASSASPEAVIWCTGIFDLIATALLLACVIVSRGYARDPTLGRRALFIAIGLTALLSKEIAAVAGVLVLLDAWAARRVSRVLIVDAVALMATASTARIMTLACTSP